MILGMMRIKNEARWIRRVVESLLAVCDQILIFDDHSIDDTRDICCQLPRVFLYESPFEGLNEVRDKQFVLDIARKVNPEWIVAIDGDEILEPASAGRLRAAMDRREFACLSLRVAYLWNDEQTIRVDGVYGDFHRESVFRPSSNVNFEVPGNGPNFHCGNVPVGNRIRRKVLSDVRLLHLGYMHAADRIRKYHWYNSVDPNNKVEDFYRHMVVGDIFPARSKFVHGGPLELRAL